MNTAQTQKPVYKQKRFYFGMGIVALILIIMAVHSDTKTTPTGVEPSPEVDSTDVSVSAAKTYWKVFTFSGNGAKKSELFTVYGERFKIVYECEGDPALTLCQAFAYEIGSGLPHLS